LFGSRGATHVIMTACWGAGEVGVLMGVKGRCVVRAKRAVSVSGAAGGRAFWVAK